MERAPAGTRPSFALMSGRNLTELALSGFRFAERFAQLRSPPPRNQSTAGLRQQPCGGATRSAWVGSLRHLPT